MMNNTIRRPEFNYFGCVDICTVARPEGDGKGALRDFLRAGYGVVGKCLGVTKVYNGRFVLMVGRRSSKKAHHEHTDS